MSPAEFLADIEVAVTDRDVVVPGSYVGVDHRDELIAAATALSAAERNADPKG